MAGVAERNQVAKLVSLLAGREGAKRFFVVDIVGAPVFSSSTDLAYKPISLAG